MAIRTYKITLDSKNYIAPEPVCLRQGDKTGAVVIDATLMDNGSPVSLDGLTPSFMANTADGKAVISDSTGFNIVNASGGEFTYQVSSKIGSVPGKIKIAYFSFADASGNQSTFDVAFIINKAADMTNESAKDWVSNLNEIIEQYNQWANDAHNSWEDFVNDNKTIIESIDPGGKVLSELIGFRHSDMLSKTFDTAKLRGDFFDQEFYNRGINVKWFGAVGDGVTDDTDKIQAALDTLKSGDQLIFEKGKVYNVSSVGLIIKNLSDVNINGNESTILINGAADADTFAFYYSGKNEQIDFHDFNITGNLATTGKVTAFGCHSGQNLIHSKIHDLTINNVNVGMTLNAQSAGKIDFNEVFNNKITDIIGENPGYGYAIHLANANNNKIYNNIIINAQRHSIYHSFGENNEIYNNTIKNHRASIANDINRAAMPILRKSISLKVHDNNFIGCWGGSIVINTLNELGDMRNIDIYDNNFVESQGLSPTIYVGGLEEDVLFKSYQIKIRNNNFDTSNVGSAIKIDRGIGVFIEDNYIDYLNLTDRANGIVISPKVKSAADIINIKRNTFLVNGVEYPQFRGILFSNLACTDATINIEAAENEFPTIYGDAGKKYYDYAAVTAITNPNLNYQGAIREVGYVSAPPATGFYDRGAIAWNNNPTSHNCVGWVCVVEGNPGTWVKFGALIS